MIIRTLFDRRYRNLRNLGLAIPCGIVAPQSGAERREPAAFLAFAEDDTQLSDISCLHWQSVTDDPGAFIIPARIRLFRAARTRRVLTYEPALI